MDIQFCLHPHAVGVYIASYMCKGNKYLSQVMSKMSKTFEKSPHTLSHGLHVMGAAILNAQEISSIEACYILLGSPLRFASRSFLFVNTSHPTRRVLLLKKREELSELDLASTDIFHPYAMIRNYENRPKTLAHECLADFAA